MALEKGTTLAGYEITGILGQGGMGVVYEANQISLNRTVALKVLAPHLSDDLSFRERFRREGQIQAGIDHQHIVSVYEAGQSEHGFFIAMRLIRGPNLKDLIVSRQLDPGRTLRILSPVAEALDAAHDAGLIHRDIKPQNILVGGRDQAFLADFGLTKTTGDKSLTKTGQFVGTFDYISPEQIKGEHATTRSDVYALAAVLYECFTGVVPYPKDSEAAVLYAHMTDLPPKITDQRPELPATLDRVIAAGMSKDPAERFETASELLLETNRSFTRRMRAAFTPPGPIETAQETGIRPAEVQVDTRQQSAPGEVQDAEAPALDPEVTAAGAAHPETAAAESAALQETDLGQAGISEPDLTRAGLTTPRSPSAPPPRGAAVPAPPAPARPPARRANTAVLVGAGAALIAAVVAIGFLIGSGSSDSNDSAPAAAADSSASRGVLKLSFPDNWAQAANVSAPPGLSLRSPIALSQGNGAPANTLVAGTTTATGPALLPAAFLGSLPSAPSRDDAVKIGALEAYRYRNLQPRGYGRDLTLYVAPTNRGVVTVACTAVAKDAGSFLPSCEQVAGNLELIAGKPYPLGPDEKYLSTLNRTIDQVNSARKSGRRKLDGAKTPGAQAQAAEALARAYRQGRSSLQGLSVSPAVAPANASVRRALAKTETAYGRVASAARRGSRRGYRAAGVEVRAGERAVNEALKDVYAASS